MFFQRVDVIFTMPLANFYNGGFCNDGCMSALCAYLVIGSIYVMFRIEPEKQEREQDLPVDRKMMMLFGTALLSW